MVGEADDMSYFQLRRRVVEHKVTMSQNDIENVRWSDVSPRFCIWTRIGFSIFTR